MRVQTEAVFDKKTCGDDDQKCIDEKENIMKKLEEKTKTRECVGSDAQACE